MKTLFVLGAGASRSAGVPLLAEFLDRAEQLSRSTADDAAKDVFAAIAELQSVYAKSYLDLDNLEALFGAVEMAGVIGKLASRDRASIERLRANLVSLIVRTIERTTTFKVANHVTEPAVPYGPFVEGLKKFGRLDGSPPLLQVSFLTLNYDLALDHALATHGVPFHYGLGELPNTTAIPLLKLHGSINWGICTGACGKVVPVDVGSFMARPLSLGVQRRYLTIGSDIGRIAHCDKPLAGSLLVPPTWNKTAHHADLADVWRRAAVALGEAESIFVIGYSMPETDAFFRYLFALGTASSARVKRIWIVNPDETQAFRNRVQGLIGQGVRGRLRFIDGERGDFGRALSAIFTELEAELAAASR